MLRDLQLRNFRCFESMALEFGPGFTFIVGANGRGKTTLLEAACVLLRLQSQRSSSLAPAVRLGQRSFLLAGHVDEHLLQFFYSALRRKVAFDGVEQREQAEYLRLVRVVSFANHDLDLIRGPAEIRRRYLDFIGTQTEARYRPALRTYERALRSRNSLLKSAHPRPRELAAYTEPLLRAGTSLRAMRAEIVRGLAPSAAASQRAISGGKESLGLEYAPGCEEDFAAQLARTRAEEDRLRLTTVGPHRDDLRLLVEEMPAAQFASEGQQRTSALALKLAQAALFMEGAAGPPLLLIDDIFGELDAERRNALLSHLPNESQKLVTATSLAWQEGDLEGPVLQL
ncbi:MAG TPA: DNA replication and repair protein RecF [Chthoniobacterales bacterium]|jgi:DNA replication and repair protein RecF|nr:DNA replication and repair protein RecF [Chthoniobacterales bacterium]